MLTVPVSGRDASARAGQSGAVRGVAAADFATSYVAGLCDEWKIEVKYPQIATFGCRTNAIGCRKAQQGKAVHEPRSGSISRSADGERDVNNQLDKAGQTILQLLGKAADVAEKNSRHAIDTAQLLSHQLRAAEDRISELEAEVAAYREQAERAEEWLHRVYTEIEDRFLRQGGDQRGTPQLPQGAKRR